MCFVHKSNCKQKKCRQYLSIFGRQHSANIEPSLAILSKYFQPYIIYTYTYPYENIFIHKAKNTGFFFETTLVVNNFCKHCTLCRSILFIQISIHFTRPDVIFHVSYFAHEINTLNSKCHLHALLRSLCQRLNNVLINLHFANSSYNLIRNNFWLKCIIRIPKSLQLVFASGISHI